MAFTCPRCRRTSHHPEDERQGYCAACHDFTGSGDVCECGQCGTRSVVPPLHAGAVWCPCGSPEPMRAFRAPWLPDAAAVARYIGERYLAALPDVPWRCEAPGVSVQAVADGLERMRELMSAGTVSVADEASRSAAAARLLDSVTGSQRNPVTDSGDCGGWPGPHDVAPYGDAMEWHPGDAEW